MVFFDGDCSLCSAAVQFVIARDPDAHLQFASLQSPFGQHWSARANVSVEGPNATMLFLENGELYRESDAALRVARHLGVGGSRWFWRLFSALSLLVPRVVRNAVYRWVARNRRRLGFEQNVCWRPTQELQRRFVS